MQQIPFSPPRQRSVSHACESRDHLAALQKFAIIRFSLVGSLRAVVSVFSSTLHDILRP
jgi:hypothetical protein